MRVGVWKAWLARGVGEDAPSELAEQHDGVALPVAVVLEARALEVLLCWPFSPSGMIF